MKNFPGWRRRGAELFEGTAPPGARWGPGAPKKKRIFLAPTKELKPHKFLKEKLYFIHNEAKGVVFSYRKVGITAFNIKLNFNFSNENLRFALVS